MAVEYPIGEKQTINEEDIPDYSNPIIPTYPTEVTDPTDVTGAFFRRTEPPTIPEGQMTLYVSNAVN